MTDLLSQFQFTTLPVNRTSKRAPKVIKLTAKTDGIPRPEKTPAGTRSENTPTPSNVTMSARVIAGQRQTMSTPAPVRIPLSLSALPLLH